MIGTQEALEARDNLTYIVNTWPTLRARLHGGGGNALTGMPRHRDTRLPINIYVSDLMREIEDEARTLAYVLIDEVHGYSPYTSEMPGLLRDIALHHGHWTAGDDIRSALDFTDWAHEHARKVRGVAEMPEPSTHIGPCQAHGCEGDLYVRPGWTTTSCPECDQQTTVTDQMRYLRDQLETRLMTLPEILTALTVLDVPVPRSTLYRWAGRRMSVAVDMDGDGDLYRLADALWLAQRRKGRIAA